MGSLEFFIDIILTDACQVRRAHELTTFMHSPELALQEISL